MPVYCRAPTIEGLEEEVESLTQVLSRADPQVPAIAFRRAEPDEPELWVVGVCNFKWKSGDLFDFKFFDRFKVVVQDSLLPIRNQKSLELLLFDDDDLLSQFENAFNVGYFGLECRLVSDT